MKFTIQTGADNPILRTDCEPIETHELTKYAKIGKDMLKYIKNPDHGGIGLAAPQIGMSKRMIVCGLPEQPDDEHYQVVLMINPEILAYGKFYDQAEEGCLSLPQTRGIVERATSIKASYLDEAGRKRTRTISGFGARVVQHEVDHINGILFIDKIIRQNPLEIK